MISRVRLLFKSVSEIVGTQDIGLLVLTDDAEQRQVVMPCDKFTLDEFLVRMEYSPYVGRLLPEVLWNVLQWQTNLRFEIHIDSLKDGKYQAVLSNEETTDMVPISAAQGVLLSFLSRGDIPVMMSRELFMRQSTEYDINAYGVSLPVNTISDEMLQSALEKAISNENYEMASHLRDEMNRRRKNSSDKPNANQGQDQSE